METEEAPLAAETLAKCLPPWQDKLEREKGRKAKRKCGGLAA